MTYNSFVIRAYLLIMAMHTLQESKECAFLGLCTVDGWGEAGEEEGWYIPFKWEVLWFLLATKQHKRCVAV